jgi:integrase/recombinase XerC
MTDLVPLAPAALVPAQPSAVDDAVDAWLRSFPNEGTRRSFAHAMTLWRAYLDRIGRDLADPHPVGSPDYRGPRRVDANAWRDELRDTISERTGRRLSGKTVDARLIAIRSFYEFLCEEGALEVNPIQHAKLLNAKVTKPTPALSKEEMGRLAAAFADLDPTRRLFASVHSTTICRVSEALNIRVSDIQRESGHWVVWLTRKGGARGYVALDPAVHTLIEEHVSALGLKGDDLLFSRPGWPPMTYSSAKFTYQLLGVKAGLCVEVRKSSRGKPVLKSIVKPHMLRATGITLLLDMGRPVDRVQKLAGHVKTDTTVGYDRGAGSVRRQVELVADLAEIIHQG